MQVIAVPTVLALEGVKKVECLANLQEEKIESVIIVGGTVLRAVASAASSLSTAAAKPS